MPPLSPFNRSCLALAIGHAMATPTHAATITVNTTADNTTATDSFCTLREAIGNSVNASDITGGDCIAGTGTDIIEFSGFAPASTITLGGTYLYITSGADVTINGPGRDQLSIDGNDSSLVFKARSATLQLNSLTVTGGSSGAAANGGGIVANTFSNVTITDSTVTGNTAGNDIVGGGSEGGGGIWGNNNSTITLINSTVSNNLAHGNGGGVFSGGPSSSLTLTNSIVSGNEGDSGGGIATNNVSATLTNIVVRDNLAKYYGGGIQARFTNVTLSDSTVSNNSVGYGIYGFGGGIYARGSNIDITNSTISGNSAYVRGGGVDIWSHNSFSSSLMLLKSTVSGNLSKNGGGIHAMAYNSTTSPSTISLSNSTISGNSATDNGGGVYANYSTVTSTNSTISGNRAGISGGGIYTSVSSYVYLNNSIVSGNRLAPGQVAGFEIHDSGLSSTFTTNDANLFGDNSKPNSYAFTGFSPGASDIDATSDKDNIPLSSILDSLGNNGGPTRTLGLKKDSPAIDAGNNGICPATDQRGELRDDGLCDIGAFEGFVNDGSCYVIRDTNSKTIVFCL